MPEASGNVTLEEIVKCPHCGKSFLAKISGEATIEFDMRDYAPEWDEP